MKAETWAWTKSWFSSPPTALEPILLKNLERYGYDVYEPERG